jgi:hypothetical protein
MRTWTQSPQTAHSPSSSHLSRNYVDNLGNVNGAAALIANKINALEARREQLQKERTGYLTRAQAGRLVLPICTAIHSFRESWLSFVATAAAFSKAGSGAVCLPAGERYALAD